MTLFTGNRTSSPFEFGPPGSLDRNMVFDQNVDRLPSEGDPELVEPSACPPNLNFWNYYDEVADDDAGTQFANNYSKFIELMTEYRANGISEPHAAGPYNAADFIESETHLADDLALYTAAKDDIPDYQQDLASTLRKGTDIWCVGFR